jgi:hypothetical protein
LQPRRGRRWKSRENVGQEAQHAIFGVAQQAWLLHQSEQLQHIRQNNVGASNIFKSSIFPCK